MDSIIIGDLSEICRSPIKDTWETKMNHGNPFGDISAEAFRSRLLVGLRWDMSDSDMSPMRYTGLPRVLVNNRSPTRYAGFQ